MSNDHGVGEGPEERQTGRGRVKDFVWVGREYGIDPDVSDQPTSPGMHELPEPLRCGGISRERLRG